MSLPRKLVSNSVKSLRKFTDYRIINCRQNKHIKLPGYLEGRQWIFMIACSPQPHYSHKLRHIKLSEFIQQLPKND